MDTESVFFFGISNMVFYKDFTILCKNVMDY